MDLQCFNVICLDTNGNRHEVGIMTSDKDAAMHSAINSLFEGKHVTVAKVIDVLETDRI